jgi:hypothetical protein
MVCLTLRLLTRRDDREVMEEGGRLAAIAIAG